jgi:hypothetical protein
MSYKSIAVMVEGQTEERFIKYNLDKYLFEKFNLNIIPVIYTTSIHRKGNHYKGGGLNLSKVVTQVSKLLNSPKFDVVTTFLDYYALPHEFLPDMSERLTYFQKAEKAETRLAEEISDRSFIPYIQMYEFESLLFSCTSLFTDIFPDEKQSINKLIAETSVFTSPEEINDGPDTHPSARLEYSIRSFKKIIDSQRILSHCTIDQIRNRCPRFNSWVESLTN